MKVNGYILYQDAAIAVIATGFQSPSANAKTGPVIQVYILARDTSPVEAVRNGRDALICLDCIHRGNGYQERSCYVDVSRGPLSVWRAYKRGLYPQLTDYGVFNGRAVRLGAYGEPCLIPLEILRAIVTHCATHTGYTHQWGRIDGEYMQYLMASADTQAQATEARSMGYRTFRASANASPMPGEIICPNDTRGIQCIDCKLCNGATRSAKSIVIEAHGIGARHLQAKLDRQLIQIGA